jgi:hypothetical protein
MAKVGKYFYLSQQPLKVKLTLTLPCLIMKFNRIRHKKNLVVMSIKPFARVKR